MNRRGMTLIELSVCVIVMALTISIVSMLLHTVHESFTKTGQALGDVATASRLLDDLKADLRRARTVAIAPDRVDLEFETGIRVAWHVLPAMITREGDGPDRQRRRPSGQRGHGEGDHPSQHDAGQSAGQADHDRFDEKLRQRSHEAVITAEVLRSLRRR